jgi:hypothetical protein
VPPPYERAAPMSHRAGAMRPDVTSVRWRRGTQLAGAGWGGVNGAGGVGLGYAHAAQLPAGRPQGHSGPPSALRR